MQQRRRQILDAAAKCGLRKGWGQITVDEVAAAASLSKGALYVHFQSKQALLLGLLERSLESIEAIAECRTAEDFCRSFTAQSGSFNAAQGRQLAIRQLEFVLESARNPAFQTAYKRSTERLIENVTAVVRRLRPELGDTGASEVALTLIILLHGTRSLRVQSDIPSEADLQRALERQMNALLRPAAASARPRQQRNSRRIRAVTVT